MSRLFATLWLLIALLAACAPNAPAANAPTVIPFPTVTPGRLVHGILSPVNAPPADAGGQQLANPATAVALANLPTPTPNYAACPASGSPDWPQLPSTGPESIAAITRFVSDGGSPAALNDHLRDDWNSLGETGTVRADSDFIGSGAAQLVITYQAPGDGGTLLILACANGRYAPLYQAITGTMPQLINMGDMNADGKADLLYSSQQCSADNAEDCVYRTLLLSWSGEEGRFVNLLNTTINSLEAPSASDTDDDRVLEVVVRLTDDGNRATGPLRTGLNVYDWNGQYYTLSIVQLDPPRFVIQVIHEADRAFERSETEQAMSLFNLALNDTTLRYWFNDEPDILKTYSLYRRLLLDAYTDQQQAALDTLQQAITAYPIPDTPVYRALIDAFWNGWQTTNNLHSACQQVQAIISARPEALDLLNRYGSRSPVYTASDLCPF